MQTRSVVYLVLMLVLWLPLSSVQASDWRQGISIGGTHMVGYDLEAPLFGPLRLEASLGLWELALTSSETLKQYYESSSYNFFFGAGFWQITAITPDEGGMINMVRAVMGAEWPLNRYTVWGLELGVNYPYPDKGVSFWGRDTPIEFNRRVAILLPRFYYRWEF